MNFVIYPTALIVEYRKMKYRLYISLSLFAMTVSLSQAAKAQRPVTIEWSVATMLPAINGLQANPGVAGAFAGMVAQKLVIAGGANFPGKMPWLGGRKNYCREVYLFDQVKGHWQPAGIDTLPQAVAYGASVQTTHGLLCIGGENEQGITANVFLLEWSTAQQNITLQAMPSLPVPFTNAAATIHNNRVYVAGGETGTGVSDKIYLLNMDAPAAGWTVLATLPVPVSHAVLIAQGNSLYLAGGRKKNANGISELYKTLWRYSLTTNEWTALQSLPYNLSAGTGIALQQDKLLLLGGDKGHTFHKAELLIAAINATTDAATKDSLNAQKIQVQSTHPGFSNEVLQYNISTNEWISAGTIPYDTPVTTAVVNCGKEIFITSGEIKAGVRTPRILSGKISSQKH